MALLTAVQMAGPLCFGKLGVASESAAGFVLLLRSGMSPVYPCSRPAVRKAWTDARASVCVHARTPHRHTQYLKHQWSTVVMTTKRDITFSDNLPHSPPPWCSVQDRFMSRCWNCPDWMTKSHNLKNIITYWHNNNSTFKRSLPRWICTREFRSEMSATPSHFTKVKAQTTLQRNW